MRLPFTASLRPIPHAALCLTAGLCASSAVLAQDTSGGTLREVEVRSSTAPESATGPVNGYRAKRAVSATKTDTALAETPQSVTVVTRDQITDQGATGVQEALNYAAGVRSEAYGLDSRTDSVRVRGASPDEYLDGLRKNNGYYTSTARTDPYTLERIEVLRGPSAMLFGQGSTAGVVNLVSKRPLAERQGEVGIQVGNFGRRQIQADLTGPLTADGQWLYRLVAVGRDADTPVAQVPDDRRVFMPSLTWKPNAATSLTLQGLYQKDKTGSTSQFFPWSGTLLSNPNGRIPMRTFIGQPGDRYDSERRSLGYLFEHRLNDDWTVRQNLRTSRNEVAYLSAYGDSFSLPGGYAADPVGQRLLGRYYFNDQRTVHTLTADQHLQGSFATGAVRHQVLAGLDFARFKSQGASGFALAPPVDVFNPVPTPGLAVPALTAQPDNRLQQTGVYLQDQMRWGAWTVVAGLRHDRSSDRTDGADTRRDSATSKRLGVMYALAGGWSPYVSYSESFTPQAPTAFGTRLRPLRGEQWEAGVKYEPAGSALAFNAAAYTLEEKNRARALSPVLTDQLGRTRNQGVELEARGAVTRAADLIASYTYTDVDRQLEGLPKHNASVWGRYRFALAGTPGFSAGVGVRMFGGFRDLSSGTGPRVPGVTLVDALLAYDTAQWRFALNVQNLGDRRYFSTCLSRGDCWFGAPRTAIASATYRF
ncbi:TonB-dependent siderophore receptor [uncultured Xylophilus sp.]|uniref:TonB-dependent siderophore receptor n=1 Tax=uncultured Xylophilus sp. TaxID=296832 RepID=UPI0025CE52CD|nr:TonB-dependent siderophore receptor [uncultured Xylophilus sp.]